MKKPLIVIHHVNDVPREHRLDFHTSTGKAISHHYVITKDGTIISGNELKKK